jgi:hypothetical protein
MRIIGAIAILTLASACATPTPTAAPAPLIPTIASSTATTTTATSTLAVAPVALPIDLAGKTAATVEGQLRALGFTAFRYLAPDGKQVTLDPSWTVVSVDGAGSSLRPDSVVIVRVDKPTPPLPPKTSTKTTPKPVPPKPQPPAPQPVKPAPAPVSYANCAAVKAAGKAPIRAGQPGYGRHLDRDGDGIGCEK